jgi:2-polyprenyl-3-methyl-5-hydroxy-6-metoxy-1,4-benzoquinol methylase
MKYSCEFCGASLKLTGDLCVNKEDLLIGQCTECSLVQVVDFSHVKMENYAADEYFPTDLEAARLREEGWNKKRINYLKVHIPDIEKRKILDFGSGHGGFLQQAHGKLNNVIGYDLSRRMCEMHVASGWNCINDLGEVPSDIDTIVLFHVLEHLPRPWEMLIELQNNFKNVNTFVIEVPNVDEALNSIYCNKAYRKNTFSADHVHYFSSKTMRNIIERANLRIVVDSQLQRYTLANNMGWLANGKGGGQNDFPFLNDEQLNTEYERVLIKEKIADSVFMVCKTVVDSKELL